MTSINDKFLQLYVSAKTRSLDLRDEDGQVAAEYMGLVALAAFIIFALVETTDIDKLISETVEKLVGNIAKGESPR